MTLKIHIMLILIILYNLFVGKFESIFICYLFILMHELSHMIIALLLNIDITEIECTPFGVNVKYVSKFNIPLWKEFIIAISGPIASLIFAFLYNNYDYFNINIFICIFNMIPIYPFDGGRILKVFLKIIFGKEKGRKISTYITTYMVIVLFLLALYIAAFYRNFFVLVMCFYIVKITKMEMQKEKILKLINNLQLDK